MKEATLKLICLDFDGTIVTNKLNQILTMQENLPQTSKIECYNSVNDVQEHEYPVCITNLVYDRLHYPQRIKNLIEQLFKQEYEICITSFSQYPQIIKVALQGLELPPNLLAQIKVVCGRNINDDYEIIGKQNHIIKAQALCGMTKNNTTLIEDDIRMINIAKNYGYHAIMPPKYNDLTSYIAQITTIEPQNILEHQPYHNNIIPNIPSLLTAKLAHRKKLLSLKTEARKSSADTSETESPICSETFLSFSSASTLGEEHPENITLTDMMTNSCLMGDI